MRAGIAQAGRQRVKNRRVEIVKYWADPESRFAALPRVFNRAIAPDRRSHARTRLHNCAHTCVDYCKNFYNVEEATLSHQGTRLSGTIVSRFGGAECLSGGVFLNIPASFDDSRHPHLLNMSVTPSGGVSVTWADAEALTGATSLQVNRDLVGTHTANSITVSGERAASRRDFTETWSITFGLRRP